MFRASHRANSDHMAKDKEKAQKTIRDLLPKIVNKMVAEAEKSAKRGGKEEATWYFSCKLVFASHLLPSEFRATIDTHLDSEWKLHYATTRNELDHYVSIRGVKIYK